MVVDYTLRRRPSLGHRDAQVTESQLADLIVTGIEVLAVVGLVAIVAGVVFAIGRRR